MEIRIEMEQRLIHARQRLDAAIRALSGVHKGGEVEECRAADEALLLLEREAMESIKKEHAVPLNFPVQWDTGAPLPFVISSEQRTFLSFYLATPDSNPNGTYVNIKNPGNGIPEALALVEFHQCASVKLGSPNDEVLAGHPLDGKGLKPYSAQVVRYSSWVNSLQEINSVHPQYRAEHWANLKHFVLWFHDSTFECVAESFSVEVFHESMAALLERVSTRLLKYGSSE
jgi:hypothetical protein